MSEKICFPTIDPRDGGGVFSVSRLTYSVAEECGYSPYLLYNSTIPRDDVSVTSLLKNGSRLETFDRTVDGMEGSATERLDLPLESLQYSLATRAWKHDLDRYNTYFSLGGPCLHALPLALTDQIYDCWLGTLIEDERDTQVESASSMGKAKYAVERPVLRKLERMVLTKAQTIHCQSTYVKERILEVHNISRNKLNMLRYPIDTEKYRPKRKTDPELIVTLGRINDPRKNIPLLLKAFSKIQRKDRNTKLLLIGDKPNQRLQNQIKKLGLSDSVVTPGKVPNVVDYLQRAAVYVTPSRQEGLGIAALEAMSCGTPVVATRCGGPEDYVIDGSTGYLTPLNDPCALADRIMELLSDKQASEQMGNNARDLIRQHYDEKTITSRLKSVFTNLSNVTEKEKAVR